ncbi:MAG: DUF4332 domain-containing protein [Leptolinea sp.]|nr:DUF4332 domain-containing protein [Leptolinea sp.]
MKYCFDPDSISLEQLKERICSADLVPSREPILENLDEHLKSLESMGIETLGRLRKELKDNKRLFAIADQTGIDKDYLALLRREFESFFPKPFPLKEFDWIPSEEVTRLEEAGLRNTANLFENPDRLQNSGIQPGLVRHLLQCADLTRIQWISPLAARMLVEAGFETPSKVESANPEVLDKAMNAVNTENNYFKGRIGLRDIKRLIHAAKYISLWY